ncbi:nuclear autoantigen Sp-100-like [Sinocyclocheilus rhinocerous]|uniref:nuclear autoantigen Sp-100-like n=1 Tax=Sinocyclocheilus rhinocerous TaxID=307959 RepID=UPI0007B9C8D3|nr:PREDICTED: nuclear autoantigen Sp-100-like [Sinocyclocheilus rhinocerous]
MDGELFTDSEQNWASTSESDWMSEKGKGKGKQGGKRKMNQQNRSKKKIARSKNSSLPDLKKMNAESVMKQTKPECELKENCSETDFNDDDRRRMKEKMKMQRCFKQSNNKRPFSHQISSVNSQTKNKNDTGVDVTDVFQEVRNKKQLAVRCGKMAGCLYRIKYDNGEKCISCKGKWFTPSMFEELGGKGSNKKWKSSIYYKPSNGLQQVQLEKLIQNRCLPQYGYLRKSSRQLTQTDRCGADSSSQQNVTRRKTPNHTKHSSSDESISVAERVKLNRREPINLTETVSKTITEHIESTGNDRDSPAHPTDATKPAVSPVIEEPDQTIDFSESPDEWQNPVASEETEKTGQMQLFEFLENQFNTINNTLQSIDLSLKKLVEKQTEDTLPQYISLTPAVIENPQIHSSVKEEQITEVVMT